MDERVDVRLEEALPVCREIAAGAGLFLGPSSGANVYTARRTAHALAERGRAPRVVATVLCDLGERYLSTGMWS